MNRLQVYHTSPRDDGVDRDVCIPKLVLRARECDEIGPVDKKRGSNKLRSGYAPTKEKIKNNNNNDDDNNEAIEDAYLDSKATCRTAWDMM